MDKRKHEREATEIAAILMSEHLNVPCTILDLSPTGARLQVRPGLFLPKQFVLRASPLGRDRPVAVVWRNKTQVGVRF